MYNTLHHTEKLSLKSITVQTPLGPMVAVANESRLLLLEFFDRKKIEQQMNLVKKQLNATIETGNNAVLDQVSTDMMHYFEGKSLTFNTPIQVFGTPFQKRVWQSLMKIPPGQTYSYLDLAKSIQHPKAFRAVALANSANRLAIIIPCHRVINSNGALGGYAGGIERKQCLLDLERNVIGG